MLNFGVSTSCKRERAGAAAAAVPEGEAVLVLTAVVEDNSAFGVGSAIVLGSRSFVDTGIGTGDVDADAAAALADRVTAIADVLFWTGLDGSRLMRLVAARRAWRV